MDAKYLKISIFVFVALNIVAFALYSTAQENSLSNKNIFLDTDQDGLSDEEEKSYGTNPLERDTDKDGYGDGTEITSGYDPLKPAPGDKLVSSQDSNEDTRGASAVPETIDAPTNDGEEKNDGEENLTKEVTNKVAALINESAAENKEISIDDLNELTSELVENNYTFEDLPEITADDVTVLKVNYKGMTDEEKAAKQKEVALEYLSSISYVLFNNAPQKISEPKDIENLYSETSSQISELATSFGSLQYFGKFFGSAASSMEEMKNIKVPEEYVDMHVKGMKLLAQSSLLQNDFSNNDVSTDPVNAILQMSKLQSLMTLGLQFMEEANSEFTKYGVTL